MGHIWNDAVDQNPIRPKDLPKFTEWCNSHCQCRGYYQTDDAVSDFFLNLNELYESQSKLISRQRAGNHYALINYSAFIYMKIMGWWFKVRHTENKANFEPRSGGDVPHCQRQNYQGRHVEQRKPPPDEQRCRLKEFHKPLGGGRNGDVQDNQDGEHTEHPEEGAGELDSRGHENSL